MSAIASLVASSTSMTEETRPIEEIIQEICGLPTDLLGRISKQAVDEMGRRAKTSAKGKKVAKKTGSMPKGRVPDQLRKPREWVNYVKADAIANGWPSYTMHQARKNKETGEKEEEDIEMPGSEQNAEGAHVFEGTITDEMPKGRAFTHKDAMSLSAVYWKVKTATGTRQDLYEAFDASYQEAAPESDEEKEEKAAAKEREKERLKQEKAEEKERQKQAKAKTEVKTVAKTPVKKAKAAADDTSATTAASKAESKAESSAAIPAATPVKKTTAAKPAAKPAAPKKAKKEEWTCKDDGMVHAWEYDGVEYLRNHAGQVWLNDEGQIGEWAGQWDAKKKVLDDTVPAPEFEDE